MLRAFTEQTGYKKAMKKNLLLLSLALSLFPLPSLTLAATHLNRFTGTDLLSSEPRELSADHKKALVVVFLSAKCPCSHSHLAELKSLAKDSPEFSFVAVHANVDEAPELAKEYFKNAQLPFPVIKDQDSTLANAYQALKTPHAFVVQPDGKIAYQGGVSSSQHFKESATPYLRQALTDLKNNQPVRTPEGRTLGCIISRGEKNVW